MNINKSLFRFFILWLLLLTNTQISKSDNPEWINFTNSDVITCVEIFNNKLYVGSTGGLSIIDLESNKIEYINHANSGIPDNSISAIAFENTGTIWIGTEKAGVARFNGTEWIVYRKENSILPDNNIKTLAIDNNNNIWIGTSNGILTRNEDNSWKILNENNSPLPNNKVKKIMLGEDKKIYIATESGLSVYDGSIWDLYDNENTDLPIETATCLANNSKGELWIGTLNGVMSYIDEKWTEYNTENSNLEDNFINTISVDSEDRIWIGTNHSGIARFDNGKWIIYNTENTPLPVDRIKAMNISEGDIIWLGTSYGLIKYYDDSFITTDVSNSGIPDNMITNIHSYNNSYWIGTNKGGIAEFDGETWNVYNENNSDLPDNSIRCLTSDNENNLWVGTKLSGLCKWTGNNIEVYNTDNSNIPGDKIFALLFDEPNLWIGTLKNGIAKFDGNEFIVYNSGNSDLPSDEISSLALDSNKCLWIGTYDQGVAKMDTGGSIVVFNQENSKLPYNKITSICCDTSNNIWIGTGNTGWSGEGLAKFNGEDWEIYTEDNSELLSDTVHYVISDSKNNIWISTLRGVSKFDGDNWESFTKENSGLQDNFVFPLYIDGNDNKWIGTYNLGLSVYREDGVIFGKLPEKPEPPNGLKAELVNDSIDAFLEWGRSPSENVNYRVYRKKAAAGEFEFELYAENIEGTSFLDTAFADGVDHYYFIRAYDQSTKMESINSNTVIIQRPSSVMAEVSSRFLSVYPNPSNERFTISARELEGNYVEIFIIDLFGNRIEEVFSGILMKNNQTYEWIANKFSNSIYYVHIKTNNRIFVQPIILIGTN